MKGGRSGMFADVRGARVRYEICGEGPRRLLFLHGWGGGVDSFRPLVRDLSPEYSILVPEFPGHGQSSEPPEPWSVTEYMEATAELVEKTGFAPCGVVAHSFGCRVAILLAARRPELVGRMLLTGAAGLRPEGTAKKSARARTYGLLKKLVTLPVVPKRAQEDLRERLIQRFGSADYKVLTPSMRATFNRVIAQDLRPELGKIRTPVFLFWGEDDTETPLWMGKVMEQEIPDAALAAAPGCGHFAYLERYEQFRGIAQALFSEE